ncbi:MAG: glutathione S-transferase [Rhodocyclaceae bacterium]|jgi:glutathione S-transferase|nr:glutathione S-transferase [Rhodocyclaceae bacterium]MBK6907698.1 glutathione S-transferase [Rhodocyclaceae bacterium]
MKLIGSLTSPYVRKVRIVLAEKKIDCAFEVESPYAPGNPVSRVNPLGKVPVLILDDGTSVFDSRVIVDYLDSTTPNNRLIPASGRERLLVKRWEALADGICDAAATIFLENKRPEVERSSDWIARQRQKIDAGVAAMSSDLGESDWCCGTRLNLADVTVGCALGYLAFRFAEFDWPKMYPNLDKLNRKLLERMSFSETVPQG